MKGQITNFSESHGQGVIRGENGQNYMFNTQMWTQSIAPSAGMVVDFAVDNYGQVTTLIPSQAPFQTPPQAQANVSLAKETMTTTTDFGYQQPTINPYQAPSHMGQMGSIATRSGENPVWAEEENYGFMDWVKKCFRNYANFNGRARRSEYWYFYLFFIIVYMVAGFIDSIIGANGILAGLVSLVFIIPNLAVTARRLHDIGKSGWWQLIVYLPFFIMLFSLISIFTSGGLAGLGIGFIVSLIVLLIVSILLLVWYATDTKPESNQWGLPARRV